MTPVYVGVALLVAAQILGLYALRTRKADLVFSLLMVVMVVLAVLVGGYGVLHRVQLH